MNNINAGFFYAPYIPLMKDKNMVGKCYNERLMNVLIVLNKHPHSYEFIVPCENTKEHGITIDVSELIDDDVDFSELEDNGWITFDHQFKKGWVKMTPKITCDGILMINQLRQLIEL